MEGTFVWHDIVLLQQPGLPIELIEACLTLIRVHGMMPFKVWHQSLGHKVKMVSWFFHLSQQVRHKSSQGSWCLMEVGRKNSLIRNKSSEHTRDPDCGIFFYCLKFSLPKKILKMYDNSVVGGREYLGKLFSDFQSTSTWIPLPSLPCQSILKRVKELGLSIFIAWSYMSFGEWADSWGLFCAYLCLNLPYIDQDFWPLPAAVLLACLALHLCVCACSGCKLKSKCRTVSGGDP